ncbi:hypothetical protein MRX96_000896 [Rhipicephalus microplus]
MIAQENEDWELLLQYRQIVDIMFALEIPAEWLAYVDVLVQSFLTGFAARYGLSAVTPKLHYMVHYGRFVREVGPLKYFWAMRFQAKHQYFKKKMAACVKNFKNLIFTLFKRHQFRQSFELHGFEIYEGLSKTQSRPADWSMLPDCAKKVLPRTVDEVQSATLERRKYRCGSVLVSRKKESLEFYEIQSLLFVSGQLYILTSALIIDYFDRYKYCYCVKKSLQKELHGATAENFEFCLLHLHSNQSIGPKWEV